ncbi:MAG: calycin-like domain-containing protein [Muribaculaceae bacterium]|nr:calycin-like domain-containing protein [Muribaculaceae bacterium]
MKKLLSFLFLMAAICVNATQYTGTLQTKAPEGAEFTPVETTVDITKNADGTYNFKLNNWMYGMNGHNMGLGTLVLDNIEGTETDGIVTLNAERTVALQPGDDASIYFWVASYMGEVPVKVMAKFNAEKLYAEVSADGSVKPGYSLYEATFGEDDFPAVASQTKVYSGILQTKAPEGAEFTPVETTVDITKNADGTYNFRLNNWMYGMNGHNMGLGTLVVENIEGTESNGTVTLNAECTVALENGDDPSIYFWVASYMGEVPVTVNAKFNADKLYAEVTADGSVKPGYSLYEATFGEDDFGTSLLNKTYTGSLQTKAPEGTEFSPVETTVEITENADGTYNFRLNNWMYGMNGHNMGLGTLVVDNIEGTKDGEYIILNAERTVALENGDDPSIYFWVASYMGEVPVKVMAKFNDDSLYAEISADGSVKPGYSLYEATFGDNSTSGVTASSAVENSIVGIYTINGVKVSSMAAGGTYIIRYSNGTSAKIVKR